MGRRIDVVEHSPKWATLFAAEADRLASVFGSQLVAVHHIGSTAIPGIKAKPVIDILVEVRDIGEIESFTESMTALGYRPRGECLDNPVPGTPGRFYFSKDTDGVRSHQVHVCQEGHFDIRDKLLFRDYMTAHPSDARKYSAMKETLAREFRHDTVGYIRGKDEFVKGAIARARIWGQGQDGSKGSSTCGA